MSIYLSIDLSVHFFASPAAAGCVCYNTAAILLAATSYPNVYWLEVVVGSVTQRFGEWASASCTFSDITDLITVAHREVERLFLCSFSSPCMHAPPSPAYLPRLLLTAATFSPSRHHHQRWRWRALSAYSTAASWRQSRAACVTVRAPFTAGSL